MTQSVINDGLQIFHEIQTELLRASEEILVVSAWFTDEELLHALVVKAKQQVKVRVAVAKNNNNEKISFSELEKAGGEVIWVKPKGYGILHDKYCVIDGKVAIHGSYNWTNNAKKNNKESVIKTNHKETIESLVHEFNELTSDVEQQVTSPEKARKSIGFKLIQKLFKKSKIEEHLDTTSSIDQEKEKETFKPKISDIDEIFQSIISAELKKTNREEIKQRAYIQAREVSGDAKVIGKSMDSLYHIFVSDKDENSAKKEHLLHKIDDKVAELTQMEITNTDVKLHSLEVEINATEKDIQLRQTDLKGKKDILKKEIEYLEETRDKEFQESIERENQYIHKANVEFVKPKIKWHELTPLLLIFIGLSIAMFLFYSSSAYIMLYSTEDAIKALENGLTNLNPQVFQAEAIQRAFEKSSIAGIYVLAFVFIPLAIALVAHFTHSKNQENNEQSILKKIGHFCKEWWAYIFVIGLDVFIAIKVTATIAEIKFLSQGIEFNTPFWKDINFYLVFFLGAIPFVFWSLLLQRLIHLGAQRNEQVGSEKMKVEIKYREQKIEQLKADRYALKKQVKNLEIEIKNIEHNILELQQEAIYLPKEHDVKQKQIQEQMSNTIAGIKKKADVYKNDIENDNIQISMTSLKDRVSAFIEGWNEWLHDEFAFSKATGLSEEAMSQVDVWLDTNLKKIEQ
ncbi:phospholipase D-like domain-containing protein [Zhouia sp. PK063]|uniref:phospholipase D-like domain-containing protein n=1 Tax=Zhouia sp. PK063 TaxID=3373602 RepID=UPI0037980F76